MHQKVQEFKKQILDILDHKGAKYEFEDFDSGCCMMHFWSPYKFYCIQLEDDFIGLSLVGDDIDFSTIPDERYFYFEKFNHRLHEILLY